MNKYRRHKIFNPGWNGVDKFDEWDLALLELYEPITVRGDSKARAACLPHPNDKNFAAGTNFVLSGWGTMLCDGGECKPTQLQRVTVPAVTNAKCKEALGSYFMSESMLCAGNIEYGGVGNCQGDSGGSFK